MNVKNMFYWASIILGLALTFTYVLINTKKIAYVDTMALYDGFDMKKELERTFISVQTGRKQQLDSLELEVRVLNAKIQSSESKNEISGIFEIKRDHYLEKKQQFEEDNAQMQEQYTSKIRKQLNQYVEDYGKAQNLDYILGAEGSGALMYAKEKDNITPEVLKYINEKYKGIK